MARTLSTPGPRGRSAVTAVIAGLGAACALAVAGCDGPGPTSARGGAEIDPTVQAPTALTLAGTVTYRERIALLPDATVEMQLVDVSRADFPAEVLSEVSFAAAGNQVPIAFELSYEPSRLEPGRRYALRAVIRAAGGDRLFESAADEEVLALGLPSERIELVLRRASGDGETAAIGRTFVFDCGSDVSFTVRHGPGEAAIWAPRSLGGGYHVLSQTISGSGARYEEDGRVFWNKGSLATFEYDGRTFVDCETNPAEVPWADAARRGITFRAVGNEPGWMIEIGAERLTLLADYGERRIELPSSPPSVAGTRTTYRASGDGREVVVAIERAGCTDVMSGAAFEASAIVTLDGATLYGCGRFL